MATRAPIVGVALAGGRSSRFGGEKAVARLHGRPLLQIVLDRLSGACDAVAVSAVAGSEAALLAQVLGVRVLHDAPGAPSGPLAGLSAGLAWAQAQGAALLATLPCDLPLVPADLFDRLTVALSAEDGGVFVRSRDGVHPLCAVLRAGLAADLSGRLASGEHPPVREWLADVGARELAFDDASAFLNVNTPKDLERAEALTRP
jgi:molybdopterin-guanine dinucleotide biosynthesis protein A